MLLRSERLFKVSFGGIVTKGLAVGELGHPMRVADGGGPIRRWLNVPVLELEQWVKEQGGTFEWLDGLG